jgi:NTE family protein
MKSRRERAARTPPLGRRASKGGVLGMAQTGSAKPKIAIACQGGGSQTAFTAGALKGLVDQHVGRDFNVVSLSGTSGGAVCATLLWFGFWKGESPLCRRLTEFWKDFTAQDWAENVFNEAVVQGLRMVNTGLLPAFQLSPSSPFVQSAFDLMTAGLRRTFADFPTVLRKHIDFDEIAAWGPREEPPVLILGAANVSTGQLAKFVSRLEPIRLEHILASAAVPSIFPAVPIGGHGYWDGLFSDNPPVEELIRPRSVGPENVPEEIWVIKINPTAYKSVPERPEAIFDRRNQMEGTFRFFSSSITWSCSTICFWTTRFARSTWRGSTSRRRSASRSRSIPTPRSHTTYRGSKCPPKCRRHSTTRARSTAARKTSSG